MRWWLSSVATASVVKPSALCVMFKEALRKDQATEILLSSAAEEIRRLERFPAATGQPAG